MALFDAGESRLVHNRAVDHTSFLPHNTLKNLFYSYLRNFLNEKSKYFILEEDYKLRAAMYDVEPRAPR